MSKDDCHVRLKQRALLLLSQREHSLDELRVKLSQRIPECTDELSSVLTFLEAEGWLSNVRFVQSFIRKEVGLGHGYLKVQFALKQKGIDVSLIEHVLSEDPVDWYGLAQKVYDKKYGKTLCLDRKEVAQRMRFLMGRGFTADIAQTVLKGMADDS